MRQGGQIHKKYTVSTYFILSASGGAMRKRKRTIGHKGPELLLQPSSRITPQFGMFWTGPRACVRQRSGGMEH